MGDGDIRGGLQKYSFNLLVHLLLRRFYAEGRTILQWFIGKGMFLPWMYIISGQCVMAYGPHWMPSDL